MGASFTINGPVVAAGVHNTVLRDARFHSPVARPVSTVSYYVLEIGIREGSNTSWIGTWDQSEQSVTAGTPVSVLDGGRPGMRLKAGQAIVVKVTAVGTPASLSGARINFALALVGGRDGPATPLVAAGTAVQDVNVRTALAALERQVNTGGLSEWEEPVQLVDPLAQAGLGQFQGRLQYDSSTQISLQRHTGDYVEIDGRILSIGSSGITCTTSDTLLTSSGGVGATAPSTSTTYYVYVSADADLRLCATAPSLYLGTYYLGTEPGKTAWRWVGVVRTNGSTQFTDSDTSRMVRSYYNRVRKRLYTAPGYSDNNSATTWTTTSTTWVKANGGTGSGVAYVGLFPSAGGEEDVEFTGCTSTVTAASQSDFFGLSVDAAATGTLWAGFVFDGSGNIALEGSNDDVLGTAYTMDLMVAVSGGTGTYYADNGRLGATADVPMTYLMGWIEG